MLTALLELVGCALVDGPKSICGTLVRGTVELLEVAAGALPMYWPELLLLLPLLLLLKFRLNWKGCVCAGGGCAGIPDAATWVISLMMLLGAF